MIHETIIPWLADFLENYPNVDVEIDIKESMIDLNTDDYDIFWGVSEYLGEHSPNLKRRTIWSCDYGLYASPSYLSKHSEINSPDDLDTHTVVGYLHNKPENILVLQSESGDMIYKTIHSRVKSATGLVELASNALGLINAGSDDRKIVQALKSGELTPVLQEHWYKNVSSYVYFHQVKGEQAKVRAFIDYFIAQRKHW